MRKPSIYKSICALLSIFVLGASVGCGSSSGTQSSSSSGGVNSESTDSSSIPDVSGSGDSSSTPDGSSTPDNSSTADSSSTPDTPEIPDDTKDDALTVTELGEVFPYIDNVKAYLQAGAGAKVSSYHQSVKSQYAPVQVKWKYTEKGARKFLVEYATKPDFSDAISVEAGATKRSVDVYNLYKATTYYVRVSALDSKGETLHSGVSTFQTTSLGPRFMMVDDVHNVRDLGGYVTVDGKTLAQGIAYRGGALTIPPNNIHYNNEISADGKQYMSEVMGIKNEIDFRTAQESGITLEQGSVIPNATLTYLTLNGYNDTFDYKKVYLQFFEMLADENSYPIYMHCTGGADRTGSVVFLLHTLLGVSDLECVQGYELTSFSTYGIRDTQSGTYKDYFQKFMAKLDTYAGNTKQEKVETWVRSIGVTQAQIDKIKAIFYGEIVIEGKTFQPSVAAQKSAFPAQEKKTLSEQYEDVISGWTIEKKEDNR